MAMPLWLKEKLFQKSLLRDELQQLRRRRRLDKQAAVRRASPEPRGQRLLSLAVRRGRGPDHGRRRRVGDDLDRRRQAATSSTSIKEIHFPHSLGLLYSAFTYYTGFKVNSGEYKVMGLAPYGEPKFAQTDPR